MARSFRICDKKRGHRRTGSKWLGRAGEALFFAVVLLLGCGGLVLIFATLVIPEWRVNHEFASHQCTVLATTLERKETKDGQFYRPRVRIEYKVGEETYRAWTYDIRGEFSAGKDENQASLDMFHEGEKHLCWYDPLDPNVVVLVHGYTWLFWLSFLVPGSFLLIGGGGLLYTLLIWGKSAERRAAIVGSSGRLDLFDSSLRSTPEYPFVPHAANITNSPGTTLAYRLPIAAESSWTLVIWLATCLLWNGIVSVFGIWAVKGFVEGEPDWVLTSLVVPFLLFGIGLAVFFVRWLVVRTGVGPTLVEIAEQPLYPGRPCDLVLSQTGPMKMKSLEILLVCEEEATYQEGTHTRTECRPVYRQQVLRQEGVEVPRGTPLEARLVLEVPTGAMHSFKSAHNEINWKLVVKGDVIGWPGYERSFPVVVYPGDGEPLRAAAPRHAAARNGSVINEKATYERAAGENPV